MNNNMTKKTAATNLIAKMLASVVILCLMMSSVTTKAHAASYDYTWDDVVLLANVMWLEEGIYFDDAEGEYVLKLCGSVVLHRMDSDLYPDTMHGVVYQKGQYASKGNIGTETIPDIVYVWAEDLLRDGAFGPDNLFYQAQFKQGSEVYYEYGNQFFCLQ